VVTDRRVLACTVDPVISQSPFDVVIACSGLEKAKEVNPIFRGCFETGEDDQPSLLSRFNQAP